MKNQLADHIQHAVSFLQAAYTILLALALSEAFKQIVSEDPKKNFRTDRIFSLLAFLFMIFPFFHGMSRYLFLVYLAPKDPPAYWPAFLMFDGVMFMGMSACFFFMSRSLDLQTWKRYYANLFALLIIDSAWIVVGLYRKIEIYPWLVLNIILGIVVIYILNTKAKGLSAAVRFKICAGATLTTTVISYIWMRSFYFSY